MSGVEVSQMAIEGLFSTSKVFHHLNITWKLTKKFGPDFSKAQHLLDAQYIIILVETGGVSSTSLKLPSIPTIYRIIVHEPSVACLK
jgi:hypothetical protein